MTTHDAFASKAELYTRYRVDYPPAVVEWIGRRIGVAAADMTLVDLGSGTGLLTKHFVSRVGVLYGVEPSADMRRVAEARFAANAGFRSVDGSAEQTGLAGACADAIVCGNAFHYFDPIQTRTEARRILRGRGPVAIATHAAPETPNAFMRAYLQFIASVTPGELREAHRASRDERQWLAFFGSDDFERVDLGEAVYPLGWDALRGRFASTSIAPPQSAPDHDAVFRRLHDLYADYQQDGVVSFALRWICVARDIGTAGAA